MAAPKKKPATKKPKAGAYQGAIDGILYELLVRNPDGTVKTYDPMKAHKVAVLPPDLFALVVPPVPTRRYLHLVQVMKGKKWPVLLQVVDTADGPVLRVPPAPAWQRAIITGHLSLYAADAVLTAKQILIHIGPHQPPPTPTKPPYT